MIAGTAAVRFSTCVMSRANANRSPLSIRSTSTAGSTVREVASAAMEECGRIVAPGAGGRGAPRSGESLGLDERQIGLDRDVVGQLEDQQLRDLHGVIGEGRRQLGANFKVVRGESKALLRLDLIGQ